MGPFLDQRGRCNGLAADWPQNTWDCAAQLLGKEGVRGLYQGLEPMIWRNAAWNGTYFACIGSIRNLFPAQRDESWGKWRPKPRGCLGTAAGAGRPRA
jgi:hypothetical protein